MQLNAVPELPEAPARATARGPGNATSGADFARLLQAAQPVQRAQAAPVRPRDDAQRPADRGTPPSAQTEPHRNPSNPVPADTAGTKINARAKTANASDARGPKAPTPPQAQTAPKDGAEAPAADAKASPAAASEAELPVDDRVDAAASTAGADRNLIAAAPAVADASVAQAQAPLSAGVAEPSRQTGDDPQLEAGIRLDSDPVLARSAPATHAGSASSAGAGEQAAVSPALEPRATPLQVDASERRPPQPEPVPVPGGAAHASVAVAAAGTAAAPALAAPARAAPAIETSTAQLPSATPSTLPLPAWVQPLAGSAASAPPAGAATLHTAPDHPGFADELGTQLLVFTRAGIQRAELRLNPQELGPVQVQILLDGRAAQVQFGAEHAATRDALLAALPQLARALEAEGLQWQGGSVQAQLQQGASGQSSGHARQQGQSDPSAGRDGEPGGAGDRRRPAGVGPLAPAHLPLRPSRGLIDLVA